MLIDTSNRSANLEKMVNGHDVCHGGFIFMVADSAFAFACNCYDDVTVASGADVNFLYSAKLGDELVATARETNRGRRTGVYAEHELLDAAAAEFADTESMLEIAEDVYGSYRWDRYDLLILPNVPCEP